MDMNISPGVNRLYILLTRSCQLKCSYCHLKQRNTNIREDVLYKAIELLFGSDGESMEVQFFGGEPLLRFNLIKKAVEYVRSNAGYRCKNVKFSINTNGVLLTRRTINYFEQNSFYIMFGLNCDVINGIRLGSTLPVKQRLCRKIFHNLSILMNSRADYRVYLTISPADVEYIYEELEYLYKFGIKEIFLIYEVGIFWPQKHIDQLFYRINKFVNDARASNFIVNSRRWEGDRVISPEFAVDCDGRIYFIGGLLLEKKLKKLKNKFYFGNVNNIKSLKEISRRPSDIRNILLGAYRDSSKFMEIILSNLDVYSKEKRLCV